MNIELIKDKYFTVPSNVIKCINKDLSLCEFLLIMYFINNLDTSFDALKIAQTFNISVEEVMMAFDGLLTKELITLEQGKDLDGKIVDVVSLDSLYKKVASVVGEVKEVEEKQDIFEIIAKEFVRKLTPMDCEIITAWIDMDTPEELIVGALKDASYNGVKTLKYMDQKIYDWNKRGFKTMEDVNNFLSKKNTNYKQEELFEYDWIDEE